MSTPNKDSCTLGFDRQIARVKGTRATLPVSIAITKEMFSIPKKGDEDEVYI
jgi:hypothetical protein